MKAHESRIPIVIAARVGRITGLFRPRQEAHLDVYLENTTVWVSTWGLYTYYPMALLAIAGGVVLRRRREAVFPLLAPIADRDRHRARSSTRPPGSGPAPRARSACWPRSPSTA